MGVFVSEVSWSWLRAYLSCLSWLCLRMRWGFLFVCCFVPVMGVIVEEVKLFTLWAYKWDRLDCPGYGRNCGRGLVVLVMGTIFDYIKLSWSWV